MIRPDDPCNAEKAVHWYHRLSYFGDTYALFRLAVFTWTGKVSREAQALGYLREAARMNGCAAHRAKHLLGICYRDGRGVVRDARAAFEWLKQACDSYPPSAALELGECYEHGIGTAVNLAGAADAYEAAARLRLISCRQNAIGIDRGLECRLIRRPASVTFFFQLPTTLGGIY